MPTPHKAVIENEIEYNFMSVEKSKDNVKGRNAFMLSFFMFKNKITHSFILKFIATIYTKMDILNKDILYE